MNWTEFCHTIENSFLICFQQMHIMVSEGLNVIPGSNLSLEIKFGKVCLISQKLNKFLSVLM